MPPKDVASAAASPRNRCADVDVRMAKAALHDRTLREKRAEYGRILKRTREIAGLDQQQTADQLHADRAQVSRWESGDENAQTFRYRQHPTLRIAYLKAQAEDAQRAGDKVKHRFTIEIED